MRIFEGGQQTTGGAFRHRLFLPPLILFFQRKSIKINFHFELKFCPVTKLHL